MKSLIMNAILLALSALSLVAAGPVQQEAAVDSLDSRTQQEAAVDSLDSRTTPDLDASSPETRSLERRNGMLYCGNFASGNGQTAGDLIAHLQNDNNHFVAPHGCLRVSCRDTTGVYVCNDWDTVLKVSGNEISKHAINIVQRCCMYSDKGEQFYGYYMAGQQFTDALGGNWNVVVGYANCKHDPRQKPSDIGGWGVNKSCRRSNTYIGWPPA